MRRSQLVARPSLAPPVFRVHDVVDVLDEAPEHGGMRPINVDHDVQLLEDVLDLTLQPALGVDVEQADVQLRGVGVSLRPVQVAGLLSPPPEPLKRSRLFICL